MPSLRLIRAEAERLLAIFRDAGGLVIEAEILQPAEVLLDLYGEDIRARAFVTHDSARGEFMLRPDFTVPVVQMHMVNGAEPARYTYSGKVFRQQNGTSAGTNEHYQVGYEVFDRSNPANADAEVFALFAGALASTDTTAITGDIGILKAAVGGLKTTENRKKALLRHIWRPQRFRALLDRFGGISPVPSARKALLADVDPLANVSVQHGLRSKEEIAARIKALRKDAAAPVLSKVERDLLETLLDLKGNMPDALTKLAEVAREMPALLDPVEGMTTRMAALENRGIDVSLLAFEASYGRNTMEYYDGFVFGFYLDGQPDLSPVATGGRYDALTKVLGQGKSIPAVGGVIRPAMLLGAGT